MSKKKNKASEPEAVQAKKKLKAAEKSKGAKTEKEAKPKKNTGKKVSRFLRDFRGEIKKITWPDFKNVMKNTGIVLATVLIIGILVWVLDFGLTSGISGLKKLAQNTRPATTQAEETPTEAPADDTTAALTEAATEALTEATKALTEVATEAPTQPASAQ